MLVCELLRSYRRLLHRRMGLALVLVVLVLTGCRPQHSSLPPSILLMVADTVRADSVSAYEVESGTTPNIDELARSGLLYERAYSNAPWTLPSHASIFTGLLPSEHGVGWRTTEAGEDLDLLAEALRREGYQTFGVSENVWISEAFNFHQGFDELHHVARGEPGVVEKVRAWLSRRDRARPFFIFVNVVDAHAPYGDSAGCARLPKGVGFARARAVSQAPEDYLCRVSPEDPDLEVLRALYLCDVERADRKLGRVREVVVGASDSLITVIAADHGEHFGEHELVSHQFSLRDELLHVPLIVHGLSGVAAARIRQPVSLGSIMPSILEWVGAEMPSGLDAKPLPVETSFVAEPDPIVSEYREYGTLPASNSLAALLNQAARGWRSQCSAADPVFGHMRAILAPPYKLLRYSKYGPEVFDLEADPSEARNLWEPSRQDFRGLHDRLGEFDEPSEGPTAEGGRAVSPELLERLDALGYLRASPPEERPQQAPDGT